MKPTTALRLRPYQSEPVRAILADIRSGAGNTFTIEMSRQAGKNETSAWLERLCLVRNFLTPHAAGVKCAPTFKPQLLISIARLRSHLDAAGFAGHYRMAVGNVITLGKASWHFLSAAPDTNVVGHTASILLEVDEAQDVQAEKFNKEFRPMAASTASTTVMYGTAWSEDDLLQRTIQTNLEMQRRDGLRRHFAYPWQVVAAHNPAYGRYVQAERARLGDKHPLITTQYDLTPLPGSGRLLSPHQLAAIQGLHDREHGPHRDHLYVAGFDAAGEQTDPTAGRDRDHNVLCIARVTPPGPREKHLLPLTNIVALYAWQGTGHDALYAELAQLYRHWKLRHIAVDSTAAGEASAILLARAFGKETVTAYRFTQNSKSHLGYQLQASANTNRLHIWQPDGSPEHTQATNQLRLCRADYNPNRTVSWYVDEADGHDDYVSAIALTVEAATKVQRRTARGRIPTKERL